MAKVIKLKVVKPIDMEWKDFGRIMREFDSLGWRIKNYAVDMYRQVKQAEVEHNRTHPNDKFNTEKRIAKYGCKSIETHVNRLSRKYADSLIQEDKFLQKIFQRDETLWHTEMVNGLVREAIQTYKKVEKDIFTGTASAPSFKRGQPSEIRSRQIKIINKETLSIAILNSDGGKFYDIKNKGKSYPINLKVASRKGHANIVMKRLLSGEYTLSDSRFNVDGKDIYLQLSFKPTDNTPRQAAVDKNKILGIDLGISKAVTMQIDSSPKHAFIDGGEINSFRARTEKMRISKRNQLKYASENRRGHGRKA